MLPNSDGIQLTLDALNREDYDAAVNFLSAQEQFETTEIERLFIKGDRYFNESKYTPAIIIFERLLQASDPHCDRYFSIQRKLVQCYQNNNQKDKAVAICQELATSDVEGIRIWGEKFLSNLSPESISHNLERLSEKTISKSQENENRVAKKPKNLTEFKEYCQKNLLSHLKTLEKERQQTLITIMFSGMFFLLGTWLILKVSLIFFRIIDVSFLYKVCLPLIISIWIAFCRSCVRVYGLNFKRNIIENIVKFIDDRFDYASHLFIEDRRRTAIAFTHSQIFSKGVREPDYLEQEDCVYGTIGQTDIFFAELTVRDEARNYMQSNKVDNWVYKKNVFQGLFFEAKFAKKFDCRTFIMPNDIKNKTPLINGWRGQTINLEDPEFNRIFRVYGDNQVTSRYILSTNLIDRLVKFRQKAKRKVYISFIQGYIYIAIPYRHDLFEPKLFQSMMSFAPLKEYFENLELMLGIVEDLKLNRQIWQ